MVAKNLTARFVDTVKADIRTDYQDSGVKGLNLRVSPKGNKSWTVVYRRKSDHKQRRLTIGQFPVLGLHDARAKALGIMSKVADGFDPAAKVQIDRKTMTIKQLGGLYIEKYAKPNKRSWAADQRVLLVDVYPHIGAMKIHAVSRRDILDLIETKTEAGFVHQGRSVLSLVRKVFNWALNEDYVVTSPALGIIPPGKPARRDRVLSDHEVKTIWNALPGASIAHQTENILRLLFLTGQRSGEVCGIQFNEIDVGTAAWTIPAEKTKNGLAHVVPLSSTALTIIQETMEFSDTGNDAPLFARSRGSIESNAISQAVRKRLQLFDERWTPHDIRRTVATGLAGLGIQPHIIESCLNHISGFKSGVAGIYNRNQYEDEKRRAMDIWEAHLMTLVEGTESIVVPMARGGGDE